MNKQEEIKRDIAAARQAMTEMKVAGLVPTTSPAEMILIEALKREEDEKLTFVPVNGLSPMDAANRILQKGPKRHEELVPVDLSNVFDGTEPTPTVYIEKLHSVMSVTKACKTEDIPEQIIFAIPKQDVPDRTIHDPLQQKDLGDFDTVRYVNYDSMPKELKKVVGMYGALKTPNMPNMPDRDHFVNACRQLFEQALMWNK